MQCQEAACVIFGAVGVAGVSLLGILELGRAAMPCFKGFGEYLVSNT